MLTSSIFFQCNALGPEHFVSIVIRCTCLWSLQDNLFAPLILIVKPSEVFTAQVRNLIDAYLWMVPLVLETQKLWLSWDPASTFTTLIMKILSCETIGRFYKFRFESFFWCLLLLRGSTLAALRVSKSSFTSLSDASIILQTRWDLSCSPTKCSPGFRIEPHILIWGVTRH